FPIAAFTALFLPLTAGSATPAEAFDVRLMAVIYGATAGLLVNTLISAFLYPKLFRRRLRVAHNATFAALSAAARNGPRELHPAFVLLGRLESELATAERELRWRRAHRTLERLHLLNSRAVILHRLL